MVCMLVLYFVILEVPVLNSGSRTSYTWHRISLSLGDCQMSFEGGTLLCS
jgi:hypothetical protein